MVKENSLLKLLLLGVFSLFFIQTSFAAAQIIDIVINESVYEQVTYDPLGSTVGPFADPGENQSLFVINGTITISNVHPTEAAEYVYINLTGTNNIENLTYVSGATVYLPNNATSNTIILIPDLGAGQSTVLSYDVLISNVDQPINFTSTYSDSRIFAGQPVTITDRLSNELNASLYPTTTCIHNINIVQTALQINSTGTLYNTTFDNSTLAGTDAGNATITTPANTTLTWNVRAGGCLSAGNTTDINYNVNTPSGVSSANTYSIVSSVMTYQFNDTFSRIDEGSTSAILNAYIEFEKFLNNTLTGDNGTWRIFASVNNPTNVDINLTAVSLWVSVRNATGTGFTNPSTIDVDTITGGNLTRITTPNILLNSTTGEFNNSGSEWFFNYTFSASPIVWMDINNTIIDDGLQLTDRSVSYGINNIYVKDLYLATGYYLQISRNITRTSEANFTVFIQVINLGTSPTPASQAVQVYNFIPNSFTLTSPFIFSDTGFYITSNASETLNDPIYNGTMHQFAILENNTIDASLDQFGSGSNANNTWNVTYNLTGSGQFDFDDLFLTGVDPLNVGEYGATQAITLEGAYNFLSSKVEYVLGGVAVLGALLALLI